MKNGGKIIIVILILIVVGLIGFILWDKFVNNKKDNKSNPIPTVSEIELNTKQYIQQLEEVKIKGTNDSVKITKQVKWQVPEHEEGVTVSFAIAVPYIIKVNGQEYEGIYQLGSSSSKSVDNNQKYNFEITNLTKDGDIEILITNK